MRYILLFIATIFLAGCGPDTPCDKLVNLQKKLCKGATDCYPCVCAQCSMRWETPLRLGMPDLTNSTCYKPESCEGRTRDWAEECLADAPSEPDDPLPETWLENECDPRYLYSIWICDASGYNPAFPEVIDLARRLIYYCGEY